MEGIGIVALFLLIAWYFIPSLIAWEKAKAGKVSILIVNIFLGWTVIGWIVALAWAVYPDKKQLEGGADAKDKSDR